MNQQTDTQRHTLAHIYMEIRDVMTIIAAINFFIKSSICHIPIFISRPSVQSDLHIIMHNMGGGLGGTGRDGTPEKKLR